VNPEEFVSSRFGSVKADPDGFRWFDPEPMPRHLDFDDQTLMGLSLADEALGKLAGIAQLLPNVDLLVSPYQFKEALASARIEGTQADLGDVFQAERRRMVKDPELQTVQNYSAAMNAALQRITAGERLRFSMICDAQQTLVGPDVLDRGDIRSRRVWLGSPTDRLETATFVPPPAEERIKELLTDWDAFIADPPPMPPLIRAALLHYQFLTIHPFVDGNGRTSRMLVLLFLASEGRLPDPLLYISPYFERKRRNYYDRLQAVRERGEIQQWLQYFLGAVQAQANDGVFRARRLLDLRERYRTEVLGSRNRSNEIVEMLFANPVVTSANVKDHLNVSNQGALNLIRSLEKRNWLVQIANVGRGGAGLWVAAEIMDAMTEDLDENGAPPPKPVDREHTFAQVGN
jgi:Fic family protein